MKNLDKLYKDMLRLEDLVYNRIKKAPSGYLKMNNKRYVHSQKFNGKEFRTYINKDNLELAKQLAQKSYDKKIIKEIRKFIKAYKLFKKRVDPLDLNQVYDNLPQVRKELVSPILPTYEMQVKKWKSITFDPLYIPGQENHASYLTNLGERVRSKSEVIIANTLHSKGIAYLYEKPLKLSNRKTIYPDFTILSPLTQKEVYWEHYGMVDKEDYYNGLVVKTLDYEKNGYFRGESLITTYESSESVLDIEWINILIDKYLLRKENVKTF